MKRCLLFFLIVCMFCGCSKKAVEPVTSGFRCRIETTMNGLEIDATLDCTKEGQTTLSFEKPSEIAGMLFVSEGERCYIDMAGLQFEIPDGYAGERTLIEQLLRHLDKASKGLSNDSVFTFDDETGLPLTLTLSEQDAVVRFSQWELPTASSSSSSSS